MKKLVFLVGLILVLSGCTLQNSLFQSNNVSVITNSIADSSSTPESSLTCAKVGEKFSVVYKNQYPEHCCSGLKEWQAGMDTRISIGDKCYNTGLMSGNPIGVCINCGNGTCDNQENVCNCDEDCDAKNSEYVTIKDFCGSTSRNSLYKECQYNKNLSICDLCK